MAETTCPVILEDLLLEQSCTGNAGGVKRILFGLKDDVSAWPTKMPPATRTGLEDYVNTTTGNMVMKTGKKLFAMTPKPNTAELKYASEGSLYNMSQKASIEFNHPFLSAKMLGFTAASQNAEMVFLVQLKNGDWHLLGDKDEGVSLESSEGTSGKATTDEHGSTCTFSISGLNAATIYKGDVESLTEIPGSGSGS
jgi:hypothetical protein